MSWRILPVNGFKGRLCLITEVIHSNDLVGTIYNNEVKMQNINEMKPININEMIVMNANEMRMMIINEAATYCTQSYDNGSFDDSDHNDDSSMELPAGRRKGPLGRSKMEGGVAQEEFSLLQRRVDRMEHSIGWYCLFVGVGSVAFCIWRIGCCSSESGCSLYVLYCP